MNEKQKKCFKMIYDFIHDERRNAQNLLSLIDIDFPEIADTVSEVLHKNVKPYLVTRQRLGAITMELMYLLNQIITDEVMIELSDSTRPPRLSESDGGQANHQSSIDNHQS